MKNQKALKRFGMVLTMVLLLSFSYANGQTLIEKDSKGGTGMDSVKKLVDTWVAMWNSYDLSEVNHLFLKSPDLTYFSSEKQGVIRGFDAVIEHHQGFGFVKGGKKQQNKLWLEDITYSTFEPTVVVSAIWYFKKPNGEVQKGPVTFICLKGENDYRFIHMHFSNYKGK